MSNKNTKPVEMVDVRISKTEYARLQEKRRKAAGRSGRMSLRVPHDLEKKLIEICAKTGETKSERVIKALRNDLNASTARLFD